MTMILIYENGIRVEALLLAAGHNRMRVAIPGCKDATELRLLKDQWMSEEGDAVDIESMLMSGASVSRAACVNAA